MEMGIKKGKAVSGLALKENNRFCHVFIDFNGPGLSSDC